MNNEVFAYGNNPAQYRAALIRSIEAAGQVGHEQIAELRSMNRTLDVVLAEMDAVRRSQAQGVALQQQTLAVQQAMLAREVFQDQMEEFVYQFEKMIGQFQEPDTSYPKSTQYFLLDGTFKQLEAVGLTTAVIKGRDNKAAFDGCVAKGRTHFRQLAAHPEVKEAKAWAEAEQQRRQIEDGRQKAEQEAEEKRRLAEEQRRLAERKAAKVRLRVVLSGFATQGLAYKAFSATVLIDGQEVGSGNLVKGFHAKVVLSQGSHTVEVVAEKPNKWYATIFNQLTDMKKQHVIVLDDNPNRILTITYATKKAWAMFKNPNGDWLDFDFSLT